MLNTTGGPANGGCSPKSGPPYDSFRTVPCRRRAQVWAARQINPVRPAPSTEWSCDKNGHRYCRYLREGLKIRVAGKGRVVRGSSGCRDRAGAAYLPRRATAGRRLGRGQLLGNIICPSSSASQHPSAIPSRPYIHDRLRRRGQGCTVSPHRHQSPRHRGSSTLQPS